MSDAPKFTATIKGVFLKSLVDLVKKKKGQEGIEALEKAYGSDLKFHSVQNYPMETEIKLIRAAMTVVYGKYEEDLEWEFGKLTFTTYADSLIGKTMFSLLGKEFRKIALNADRVINTVTGNLIIEVEDLAINKVRVRIGNCPHHIGHFGGVFMGAIESFGYKPKVETEVLGEGDYNYFLEWNY